MQIGFVIYNATYKAVMHDCFFDSFHLVTFAKPSFPYVFHSGSYDDVHQWYANFFFSSSLNYPCCLSCFSISYWVSNIFEGNEAEKLVLCVQLELNPICSHNSKTNGNFWKLFWFFLHFNRLSINCDIWIL